MIGGAGMTSRAQFNLAGVCPASNRPASLFAGATRWLNRLGKTQGSLFEGAVAAEGGD